MGFTIKELETLTGIKAHTIRIWEQRYDFLKPSRTTTNIRSYNNEELKTLLTVALLNKYGYKISKIDDMPAEQRSQEVLNLQFAEARTEHLVHQLIGCMIDLDVQAFESHVDACIRDRGLEETIATVIFHFLDKIGILWQTGRINPVHEHIVSNIIRQKIIAAIEAFPLPARQSPLVLLFLPENEYHELGLLFVFFLLRRNGIAAIYLGANVPLKDVQYVTRLKKPDYLYLHLTSIPGRLNFSKFLSAVQEQSPDCRILLSGFIAQGVTQQAYPHVVPLQSLGQVVSYIAALPEK
ncbi:MAG: MerR family transcriptional regulator [Flaviaesturariibacter sp.]|nr:MerR family transcriptional regulator [Flaviaesturariibacter sp.]